MHLITTLNLQVQTLHSKPGIVMVSVVSKTYTRMAFFRPLRSFRPTTASQTPTFSVFFQIRDFVKKTFPHFPNRPPETLTDSILALDPNRKKCISFLYNLLGSVILNPHTSLKAAWEGELNMKLTDQQWDSALDLIHSSSICARHGLIQCKVLHKVHYTNARLSRIYPAVKDTCNRCNQSPANHSHMFWSCPKLAAFWRSAFDVISRAYGQTIPPNPLSAIFGTPPNTNLSVAVEAGPGFYNLVAQRLILLNWRLTCPRHKPAGSRRCSTI